MTLPAVHTAPAQRAVTVVPSDATNFTDGSCRALWVGGAGIVVAIMNDGTTGTFQGVPAGTLLPFSVRRVNSTTTTATSMVALY